MCIRDRLISTRRGDERGLLGLAFHPNYRDNGKFYVYYSTTIDGSHHSRLSEFAVSQSKSKLHSVGMNSAETLINHRYLQMTQTVPIPIQRGNY